MSDPAAPFQTGPDGLITLDPPVVVPDVVDVIVAGGGPFGTAAAFRLTELNRSVLVVDYDDVMKRIRDYAKDKLILPDFGGGDDMKFPKGDALISRLSFDPIDKDEMCRQWKAFYSEFRVPVQVGVELTNLARQGDVWSVQTWNHRLKSEQTFRARHVVLAFGAGIPRRLDISGNAEALAFALTDAAHYVGEPALVVGGGTSAAEAVIAISAAKEQASDPSAVYWSHRADKMPKVSRALADPFFRAFVEYGNVRYLPSSEPIAAVRFGDDNFLTVRTARKAAAGCPSETTQLEFKLKFCIACIGQEIPEALLAKIGAPLLTGGKSNKKRIAVTPLLESQQPNLYLGGDLLGSVYFETIEFDNPSDFKDVQRRNNIKSAIRDGVLVAEVINQKLAGKTLIDVKLEFAEAAPKAADSAGRPSRQDARPAAALEDAAATKHRPADVSTAPRGRLVSILPTGVGAEEFPLKPLAETTIGRRDCDIVFADDVAIADVHARIIGDATGYRIRDEGSAQGVFVQPIQGRTVPVGPKTIIQAGRQWLVVSDDATAFNHHEASGRRLGRYPLTQANVVVGRQSPDVTIAPDDGSLSRRHLAFVRQDGALAVRDLASQNGTFIRVPGEMRLGDGDKLRIGRQVLKFVDERAAQQPESQVSVDTTFVRRQQEKARASAERAAREVAATEAKRRDAPAQVSPAPSPAAPAPQPAPAADGPSVSIAALSKTIPCKAAQTILEVCERAGVDIDWECREGLCGIDPIKILSGGEHLNEIRDTEQETLEGRGLKPGTHRLACMTRATGPVSIEIIKQH